MLTVSRIAVFLVAFSSFWNTGWSADAFSPFVSARAKHNSVVVGGDSSTATRTSLFAALPDGYREFGEKAILEAARQCGMVFDEEEKEDDGKNKNRLDIEWKAGSIVVTVHGEVSLSKVVAAPGGEDGEVAEEGDGDGDDDEPFGDSVEESNDGGETEEEPEVEEEFSISLLARTINRILDDDGMGLAIAEVHSIEVTTPGVSDELVPGTPQFDAFKGFEVIVQQLDPKKKKGKAAKNPLKTIEGRLVERNDEFTIVNIKGRMKKMKNDSVVSIRLPKAKKEKGGR